MSEPSQTMRISPGPNLQHFAEEILRRFEEGNEKVTETITLPDGGQIKVRLTLKKWALWGQRLKVSLDENYPYCENCRKTTGEEGAKSVTVDSITGLLRHAVNSVLSCKNCSQNGGPAPAGARPEPPRPAQANSEPSPAGGRVKIIPAGGAVANIVPAAQVPPEPKTTIRIKDRDAGNALSISPSRSRPSPPSGNAYTTACIRYYYERAPVEVTIPFHVCEELVRHCGGSNQHKNEVGGLLVGQKEELKVAGTDTMQYWVWVTDIIRFKPSESSVSHLHVDADEWARVNRVFDEKYAPQNKVRLGWYHTHPTQGIFFSPQDVDTHTSFTLPFQFGLVIDPLSMTAGLLYWNNRPNTVSEPILFPLRPGPGQIPGGPRMPRRFRAGELPPLSKTRIVFILLEMALVFGYVLLTSPPYSVTPFNACLLMFNLFVLLRLRNARFFRPRQAFERKVFAFVRDVFGAFVEWFDAVSPLRFGYVAALLIGAVIVGLIFWQAGGAGTRLGAKGEAPRSPQQVAAQLNADAARPPERRSAETKNLEFQMDDSLIRVTYDKSGLITFFKNGNNWTPDRPEREKDFLRRAFNLDLGNQASVKMFQNWLQNKPGDGVWGPQTRNDLLDTLRDAKEKGQPLRVPHEEGQPELEIKVK